MIASWIERVEEAGDEPGTRVRRARGRASIALGRRDHDPVVEVHVGTLDEFVSRAGAGVDGARQLVDTRGEAGPRGSAPMACGGSARTYRATVADLAIARRQFPGDPLLGRLERLVAAGAQRGVPHRRRRGGTLREFVTHGYWRRVRERIGARRDRGVVPRSVRRCSAATGRGAIPVPASGLVPGEFQYVARAAHARRGLGRVGRRPGRVLERDLHEQHPRRDPRVRGRHPARRRRALRAALQRHDPRRDVRGRGRRRQRPTILPTGRSRTACSS